MSTWFPWRSADLHGNHVDIVVHDHEKDALPRVPGLVGVVGDLPEVSPTQVHDDGLERNPAIRLQELILL